MWAIRSLTGVVLTLVWILLALPGVGCAASGPASEVSAPADMHAEADHGAHGAGAQASDPASTNPVSIDPDLAIVTAIVFLVLLAVLGKFAWRPIIEAIDRREKMVADNLAEAQRNTDEARRLLAEHESKLAGAAAEVRQMLDQARQDADWQKQQMVQEAQTAAQQEKQRALREIHAAKTAALQELARSSVDAAVDLAGKIVGRQLSPDDHARLIGEALQRFPSDN